MAVIIHVAVWYDRLVWLFVPDMDIGGGQHNLFLVFIWVLDVSSYINSTFNFFVYYVMGSRFRVTMWELLGRKAKKATTKESAVTSETEVTES